jgi:hypothetical protein
VWGHWIGYFQNQLEVSFLRSIAFAMLAFIAASCTAEEIYVPLSPALQYGPEPTTNAYTNAAESGLQAVRPYPHPDDVCVVVGENDTVRELLDHEYLLIACPKHEQGAIADRVREGADIVAHAKHWSLLQIKVKSALTS